MIEAHPTTTTSKACSRCGSSKPIAEFPRDASRPSGYRGTCKLCFYGKVAARLKINPRKPYRRNPEQARRYAREYRQRVKRETIEAYGGKCACCGETVPEFLTVDHINNDGAQHRRQLSKLKKGGVPTCMIYVWLKAQGYPKDNFQLLCFNCNCAKGYFGQCPHQREGNMHKEVESKIRGMLPPHLADKADGLVADWQHYFNQMQIEPPKQYEEFSTILKARFACGSIPLAAPDLSKLV